MIANRARERWQLLALLEEIQLKSSQEEQQPRNRCCSLPVAQTGYTQPSSDNPRLWLTHTCTCTVYTHTAPRKAEKSCLLRSEDMLSQLKGLIEGGKWSCSWGAEQRIMSRKVLTKLEMHVCVWHKGSEKRWGGWGEWKSILTHLYCQSMTNDGTFATALALCQYIYWFYIRRTNVIDGAPETATSTLFYLF